MQSKSSVWITTSFIGFHRWPEAPAEVSYLRNLHRHLFHVRVTVPTTEDRGLEFHILKKYVDERIAINSKHQLDIVSCEVMAETLAKQIITGQYILSWVEVTVSEDNECGATVHVERGEE